VVAAVPYPWTLSPKPKSGRRRPSLLAPKPKRAERNGANGNGASLGFEAQPSLAADKLRKNLEPFDYKHVVLGLIFLRHIFPISSTKRCDIADERRKFCYMDPSP
jgi:type I restriction enzyme M protein